MTRCTVFGIQLRRAPDAGITKFNGLAAHRSAGVRGAECQGREDK